MPWSARKNRNHSEITGIIGIALDRGLGLWLGLVVWYGNSGAIPVFVLALCNCLQDCTARANKVGLQSYRILLEFNALTPFEHSLKVQQAEIRNSTLCNISYTPQPEVRPWP